MLVAHQAKHWPQAKNTLFQCGPYQIAGALRARGIEAEVEELYLHRLFRHLDWSLPWDPGLVLARHGIKSRTRFRFARSFLEQVRRSLASGNPVLMIVRSIQGTGSLHWISTWGYDATTDEFLCYDSQCETSTNSHGNVSYTSAQLLHSLPWRGTFLVEVVS